jgi:NAD(P)-dependent dehydrogenase (short-subunit alcohol dehydrogenase family)
LRLLYERSFIIGQVTEKVGPSLSLDGRAVLLTGASSGLGAQFARALCGAGARVMVAARREEPLRQLAAEYGCAYRVADVSLESDRVDLVAAAVAEFGALDILVNNAGTASTGPAENESTDDFRRVLETNLVAPFALAREAARTMLVQGRGSIVNVASVLGVVGNGQVPDAAYAASKGGLVNMTRELAAQWARRGIRVNALAPAYFESEMTAAFFSDERGMNWIKRKTPMGRPGAPGELDAALLFLASDASSYVTGQVLAVDGGWTAV